MKAPLAKLAADGYPPNDELAKEEAMHDPVPHLRLGGVPAVATVLERSRSEAEAE
jgi:hypothetical protein